MADYMSLNSCFSIVGPWGCTLIMKIYIYLSETEILGILLKYKLHSTQSASGII